MPSSPTPVVASSRGPVVPWSRGPVVLWSCIAVFAILWVDLCRQLSYTWDTNEQYAYGWFVPFLALALFIRRWPDRPGGPQDHRTTGPRDQRSRVSSPVVSGLVVLCAALLLPLRVIIEINQDWPLIAWPYALIVVALTLYAVHLAGPRPSPLAPRPWSLVSPWVAHFAFPICFILVAVQWPYRIEHSLTQNLMQVVASLTVEIIGWMGIPAIQRGNLIELSTGVLGVDEACSGIRSFQSTLMAALFLGELYRLRWPIRLLLVGAGLTAAFLLNVCRTLILTWQANAHGLSAIDKWHDPAGFTIAIACFAVLWAIAVLIKRKWPQEGQGPHDHGTTGPRNQETADHNPVGSSESSVVSSPPSPKVSSQWSVVCSPRAFMLAVGLWSLFCIMATEVWYRSHETKNTSFVHWSVQLPETKPTFQTLKMPARTLELLAYDSGTAAKWQEEDGSKWDVYFFQWQGKSIQSIMASRNHRPEVCLPAAGLKQTSDSQTDYFEVGDLKLAFRKASYSAPGQTVHVFYCIWQDGDERRNGLRDRDRGDRLLGPMEGRRRFGQQVLEIITDGYASAADAERAVRQRLPDLIRVEGASGPVKSPDSH